jgi:tRNA (cytidine32/guanosine34-2'-O)-methyltransferase
VFVTFDAADDAFGLFKDVKRVVDLCAAPGSWSQVLARELYAHSGAANDDVRIVAVDLQEMAPIEGVIQLVGDITARSTTEQIIASMNGSRADLVVCDGAPDVTGLHDVDAWVHHGLMVAASTTAAQVLRDGGAFVAKIFDGRESDLLVAQLRMLFRSVVITKPRSSRSHSRESFIVCLEYAPPTGWVPGALPTAAVAVNDEEAKTAETGTVAASSAPTVKDVIDRALASGDLIGFR